ncbi:hypothetical protein PENANT_c046G02394 [Penicillium antarcticum]|uniref:C2H2-type domain-containing protein n=1 Tax=Penicillium antarcticum TaxID=416450 RepID=A0A1V6PRM4_9EURO|nr:hypothetical protein PENANT_c046G02394 [Penicillium antarcticum]
MASYCTSYRDSEHFDPQTKDIDWMAYYSPYPWTPTSYICMPTTELFANSQCVPTLQPSSEATKTYSTTSSPLISQDMSPESHASSTWSCQTDASNQFHETSGRIERKPLNPPFHNALPEFFGDSHAFGTHSVSEDEIQTPRSDAMRSLINCGWKGCTYSGGFSREACLWRHIKSTHVSPKALKCSHCKKTFGLGREDKLRAHKRLAHRRG